VSTLAIPFAKANACGNDFLLVDAQHAPPADLAAISRRLCDRHQGIGADGVEWLFAASDADIHARLFNADGSEAEISGNGTRCVAAWLTMEQERPSIAVRTGAGVKQCTLLSRRGNEFEFEIDMGEPQLADELPIQLASGLVRGTPVSMGNPHFVVFVDEFSPGWQAEAAEIGKHQHFRQGINVEMVAVQRDGSLQARFFERGVGETMSSGTGSCASAVAAIARGRVRSPVAVHAPGGTQSVRWQERVFLAGPARVICRGEFFG
jgi:diaminopimelate epimerase